MIRPFDAWVIRRLLIGHNLKSECERVSAAFRLLVDRMAGVAPEARDAIWQVFLSARGDAEQLIRAVADQDPHGPALKAQASGDGSAGGWEPISLPTLRAPEPFPVDILPRPWPSSSGTGPRRSAASRTSSA